VVAESLKKKAPFNKINNEARVFTYKYPVSRSDKGGKV